MKIVKGVPKNEEFQPKEQGWKAIKEPNMIMAQIIALPIGVVAVVFVVILAVLLQLMENYSFTFGLHTLLALILIIPIHELLHALAFPDKLSSNRVYIGYLPKGLAFFAHYEGQMKRNRFLFVFLAPFLGISILPLIVMATFNISVPFLIDIAIWNSLLACVDLLGVILIFTQVPRSAFVRNKGIKTYWKY